MVSAEAVEAALAAGAAALVAVVALAAVAVAVAAEAAVDSAVATATRKAHLPRSLVRRLYPFHADPVGTCRSIVHLALYCLSIVFAAASLPHPCCISRDSS